MVEMGESRTPSETTISAGHNARKWIVRISLSSPRTSCLALNLAPYYPPTHKRKNKKRYCYVKYVHQHMKLNEPMLTQFIVSTTDKSNFSFAIYILSADHKGKARRLRYDAMFYPGRNNLALHHMCHMVLRSWL